MGCILKGGGGLYSRLVVGGGGVAWQRRGVVAVRGRLDAVLVVLADQPLLNAQDISALIGAWKKRPGEVDVVYPEVEGQRGNPVMFSAEVREQVLASGADAGCRQWQAPPPQRP